MYPQPALTAGPAADSTLSSATRKSSVSSRGTGILSTEGKLCPKGNYAWQFINNPDRLTKPLIKKDGKFVEASWDEAYKLIAQKFKSYKGEEMACLASARVSNEENYLMQKFARAVLKTPNIDHCARLCHASTVVGLAGSFGSGAMTQSIADIAESKCLLVIGTNTFEQHPLDRPPHHPGQGKRCEKSSTPIPGSPRRERWPTSTSSSIPVPMWRS